MEWFVIGGPEEGKKGRSKGSGKLMVLAIEVMENGVGMACAGITEHSSAKESGVFLIGHVPKDAEIAMDKRRGHTPLKKELLKPKQVGSEDGKDFKESHIRIMNIKGRLRGIHRHCSKGHMQNYLDEYRFRYNRRSNMGTIFDLLMEWFKLFAF